MLVALPERMAHRYGGEIDLPSSGLPRPPLCSLGHGAAGVAYFLLRYGALAREPGALAAAARWVALAQRDLRSAEAFGASSSRVFPDARRPPTSFSLPFGEGGVWWVSALIGCALDDRAAGLSSLERFCAVADACPADALDAVAGAASLLLGAAVLVEELGDPLPAKLVAAGERLATVLSAAIDVGRRREPGTLQWLGAAHGWCGLAHAVLRWCEATSTQPNQALCDLLERLAAARLPSGLWPRREGSSEIWPGWCHGSAGWVQLWTLAFELLGEDRMLAFAGCAGAHAVRDHDGGASLCCGLAGQAYSALALYRTSGESDWLAQAHRCAALARATPPSEDFPQHSLWGGDLGVALLITELAQPLRAAMPLCRALSR